MTDVNCLRKGRISRSPAAPRRPLGDFVQRWIYYRGYYIECGIGSVLENQEYKAVVNPFPAGFNRCSQVRESRPAGFSIVSLECMRRCVDRYHDAHGAYNFLLQNSNQCANNFAKVLFEGATSGKCAVWCSDFDEQ